MSRSHVPPGGAVAVVLLFLASGLAGSTATGPGTVVHPTVFGTLLVPAGSTVPINHIIIVFQENHVYDQFYGTYCQSVGPYCDQNGTGYPAGLCVPLNPAAPQQGCQAPYLAASSLVTSPVDLVHDWVPAHTAYDNGSMDGFYEAEAQQISTFAYYNGAEIPTYWDLAEQYGLGDNFYASVLSYSTPNHWYLVAGGAPEQGINQSLHRPVPNPPVLSSSMEQYLDEANDTETVANLLSNTSVSWKYYDYALSNYSQAINAQIGAGAQGSAFDFWNPLASIASSYTPSMKPHFVPSSNFFTDAAAGNLPNVSWVLPTFNQSDHPPASLVNGQSWVARVINAVEASPDWGSSAIFVTWDDYGGYYDHLPPPVVDANGVSFRAPLLVVSPYAREGYISHQYTYFESLLHLIEWRYGLASLTARDANAPLPLDYFDFNASPRAPVYIDSPYSATYPMALQGLGLPRVPVGLTAAPGAASVTLNWSLSMAGAAVTAYQLTYGPASDPTLTSLRESGSLESVTVSNLVPGTAYEFSLSSLTGRNSSASVSVVATPLTGASSTPPGQPATWTALAAPDGPVPTPRAGAGFVYDSADRAGVLFGGVDKNGLFFGDTWEYTNGDWTLLNVTRGPPARAYAGMTYDSTDGVVLLFGGQGAHAILGDTWKFSAGAWTNITGAVAKAGKVPAPRSYPALSDNPSASGAFLFGGKGTAGALGDSWRYAKGKWTSLSLKTAPSARWGAAMTYDTKDGYPVLVGGNASTGSLLNDTWKFSSSAWHPVTTPATPGPLFGATTVYDAADQYVLLFGGSRSGAPLAATWKYVAGGWTLLSPTAAPSGRAFAAAIFDGLHQGVVLGMGQGAIGTPAGFYEYGIPLSAALSGSPTYSDAPAVVTFYPTVTGGMAPYRYFWTFGDGTNSTLTDATHIYRVPGDFAVALYVTDAVGATVTATAIAVVGGPLSVAATGTPGSGGTVNFYATVGGGVGPYSYLWIYGDGSSERCALASPTFAYASAGVYNVTVEVTDANGETAQTTFSVSTNGGTLPVTASSNVSEGAAPLTVGFNATVPNATNGTSYSWDFGDGSSNGTGPNVSHTFSAAGRYVVRVTATNATNGSGPWGTTFLVIDVDAPLELAPLTALGSVPGSLSFSAGVVGGQAPFAYRWLFGDGSVATSAQPVHAFRYTGVYTVSLTVTDQLGTRRNAVVTVHATATSTVPATPPAASGAGAPVSPSPAVGVSATSGAPTSGSNLPSAPAIASWGRPDARGTRVGGRRRRG